MNSKQRWQDSSPVEQLEPHDASGNQGACLLSSVVSTEAPLGQA